MTESTSSSPEATRLEALRACGILDTEDPRFGEIASMARAALDMPGAMIAVLTEDQQHILANVGCELSNTPRESSFGDAVLQAPADQELFVVEDASQDPRFAIHPLVLGGPQLRSFIAAPLIVGEHRMGMIAVFDTSPGPPDERVRMLLPMMAKRVVDLMELHRAAVEVGKAREHLDSLNCLIPMCSHCRRVRDEKNVWQTLERLVQAKTGSRFTHGICPDCVRERYPDAADDLLRGRGRHRRR